MEMEQKKTFQYFDYFRAVAQATVTKLQKLSFNRSFADGAKFLKGAKKPENAAALDFLSDLE